MASFRRRGKTWSCYWYEPDSQTGQRRQRSKGGFRTRGDAEAWYIRTESNRQQGFTGAPDSLTVGDYMTAWLDSRPIGKPSPGTLARYRDMTRLYIAPYIGGTKLTRLDSLVIGRWHNQLLQRPLSARSIQHVHALLSGALNTAVDNGMLHRNPCRLVSPPTAPPLQRPRLDSDQIKAFLAACEQHDLGLLFRTGLFTLMRSGELLALRWSDIDWQRQTVHVHRTRRRDEDGRFYLGDGAKTRSGNRTLVIHDELVQRLRRHRTEQNKHRLAYAELWHDLDLVFCRDDGTMLRETYVSNSLTRVCQAAGVPRLTMHGLRHSGASLMVDLNIHMKAISERLGHSSISLTADVYLGVSEGLQRQVAQQMARAVEAS